MNRSEIPWMSGATLVIRLRNSVELRSAASYLLHCHNHHFAVLADDLSICASESARICLKDAGYDGWAFPLGQERGE